MFPIIIYLSAFQDFLRQAGSALNNPTIIAAFIAFSGAVVSVFTSSQVSRATSKNLLATDRTKRQAELSLKISELMSDPDFTQRKFARRRFAVAIVKIIKSDQNKGQGNIYFIPMNSRVTVGRDDDNDIILEDEYNFLSRWHCGFIADQRNVYIDDYISTNCTKVNDKVITDSTRMNSGDEIALGSFTLKFQYIKENSILSQ